MDPTFIRIRCKNVVVNRFSSKEITDIIEEKMKAFFFYLFEKHPIIPFVLFRLRSWPIPRSSANFLINSSASMWFFGLQAGLCRMLARMYRAKLYGLPFRISTSSCIVVQKTWSLCSLKLNGNKGKRINTFRCSDSSLFFLLSKVYKHFHSWDQNRPN